MGHRYRRVGAPPPLTIARQTREIDRVLFEPRGGDRPDCEVLSGMGGAGKTQIAAAYAERLCANGELDLLVWANAAGRDTLVTAFAEAAATVGVARAGDADRGAAAFGDWLAGTDQRWLVVFDDLAEPADLKGLWPPRSADGRTVVTTRRRDAALDGAGRRRNDIGQFTETESHEYLAARLGKHSARFDGADDLAALLGHLPIGLAHAAAYLLDHPGMTCAVYERLVRGRTKRMEQLSPETLPDDYPHSVHAVFRLSIERADQGTKPKRLATSITRLASLLDPNGIPVEVFTAKPAVVACGVKAHADIVTEMLARLHRLSLIDFDGSVVRMHALVQRVVRESASRTQLEESAQAVGKALDRLWDSIRGEYRRESTWRANALALVDHSARALMKGNGKVANPILDQINQSFSSTDNAAQAIAYYERMLNLSYDVWGEFGGPDLTLRFYRARWIGEAGRLREAIAELEELAEIEAFLHGTEDPSYLSTMNSLALFYEKAGDLEQSTELHRAVGLIRSRVLGPRHPETLSSMSNYTSNVIEMGIWTPEVERQVAEIAAMREEVLGPDHHHTLIARLNVVQYRYLNGDESGALAELEVLIGDCQRVLGPRHRSTLQRRYLAGTWRGVTGDLPGGLEVLTAVLADQEEVLGDDDPDTVMTRTLIEHWRGMPGGAAS